jgi:hypothetical protein
VVAAVADSVVSAFIRVSQAGPGEVVRDEETQLAVLAPAALLCKDTTVVAPGLVPQQEQDPEAVAAAHLKQDKTQLPPQVAQEVMGENHPSPELLYIMLEVVVARYNQVQGH